MEFSRAIASSLEKWFVVNGRTFPWRLVKDPYKVLVVEFLLQRTRAETVERVYDELFRSFPDVNTLANTNVSQVEGIFRKLGLQYRAKRLLKVAKSIVERFQGHVPCDKETLLDLEGVGPYIMSAVLNFGCDVPTAVVDKNVMRVANRLWGVQRETAAREFIQALYKYGDHKKIAYALIDLGAKICKANPLCEMCPLNNFCPKLPLRKEEWRMLRKVRTPKGIVLREQPVSKMLKWKNET